MAKQTELESPLPLDPDVVMQARRLAGSECLSAEYLDLLGRSLKFSTALREAALREIVSGKETGFWVLKRPGDNSIVTTKVACQDDVYTSDRGSIGHALSLSDGPIFSVLEEKLFSNNKVVRYPVIWVHQHPLSEEGDSFDDALRPSTTDIIEGFYSISFLNPNIICGIGVVGREWDWRLHRWISRHRLLLFQRKANELVDFQRIQALESGNVSPSALSESGLRWQLISLKGKIVPQDAGKLRVFETFS